MNMWHFKQKSLLRASAHSLLDSSPPFPLLLERVSLYTPTTDFRGQIKPFPPLTSIHPSLHQCCFVSWSAVKQDRIGKELLINNTWPVRAPPPPSSSVTLTSPLTLTCCTFSLPSAVLHLDSFLSCNPPASFLFPLLLLPSSLALNRPLAWCCLLPA